MSFADERRRASDRSCEFKDFRDDFIDLMDEAFELDNEVCGVDAELFGSGGTLFNSRGASFACGGEGGFHDEGACSHYKADFMIAICSRHALLLVPPVAFLSSTARS
jgi:hypothetical protein